MLQAYFGALSRTTLTAAALALGASFGLASSGQAQATKTGDREVVITVTKVKALDAMDVFSRADFFARVTIGNNAPQSTRPMKQSNEISPTDWRIAVRVPNGRAKVKLEVLDKDITKDDPIDISPTNNKRDIDFEVDTRGCRIIGLAGSPRCGATIVRGGTERKRAEVSFAVSVNR